MTKYLCPICKHFCFDQKLEQTFSHVNGTIAGKYVKTLAISNEQVRCKNCDHLLDKDELKEFHNYVDRGENFDYAFMEEVELIKGQVAYKRFPLSFLKVLTKGE